jgi:hypothetical protein
MFVYIYRMLHNNSNYLTSHIHNVSGKVSYMKDTVLAWQENSKKFTYRNCSSNILNVSPMRIVWMTIKKHCIFTILHMPQFTHYYFLRGIVLKTKMAPVSRMTVCFFLILYEIMLKSFESEEVGPYQNTYFSILLAYTVVLLIVPLSNVRKLCLQSSYNTSEKFVSKTHGIC